MAGIAVAVAVLVLALTTSRGDPIAAPPLPASFDGKAALALTADLAGHYPSRVPGSPFDLAAADWMSSVLARSGLKTTVDTWHEHVPGLGDVELRNLSVVVPGPGTGAIVVVAHRDNNGAGAGANDNASGTAALIQLARGYATAGTTSARPKPLHTLVFLSTDAGAFGSAGARRFVDTFGEPVLAAIVLDGLAGRSPPRLDIAGNDAQVTSPALIRTAIARVVEQIGKSPKLPGVARQIVDLGLPFALGDQAPFLGARISAARLTTADDTGRSDSIDSLNRLAPARLARLGAAAQNLLGSLDSGLELARGSSSKIVIGNRIVRGWALELALVAALFPFLVGVIDLIARCRRLGIALAPAFRSLRRRLGFCAWLGAVLWLATAVGLLPSGGDGPLPPTAQAAARWPVAGGVLVIGLGLVGWFVARRRLAPVRAASDEEVLAGYGTALAGLAVVAVATAVLHPLALLFLVPSLYAWLWLPFDLPGWRRDVLFAAGFAGAVLVIVSIGSRFGLGARTPLYLVELVTTGYIPWTRAALVLAWIAVAGQLAALVVGRYAPYAHGAARPPRGAIRETVRRTVLAAQARRR
jgi:hypothetical protein